mmetsp:Transcript_16557/g.28930  ORF Transcript_16557/g.28930 Transcript_16557/m.28930 type:complete len:142 (+) Transcript_16557:796-1221(+)
MACVRGIYYTGLSLEVLGCFESKVQSQLMHEFAKVLARGFFTTQLRHFVLGNWVIQQVHLSLEGLEVEGLNGTLHDVLLLRHCSYAQLSIAVYKNRSTSTPIFSLRSVYQAGPSSLLLLVTWSLSEASVLLEICFALSLYL